MTMWTGWELVATTIGSCQSWANSMLVPTSKTTRCLRDQWLNQVDDHIHVDPPKQGLQPLESLGGIEMGGHTPLTKVVKPPPLTEVVKPPPLTKAENWSLQPEAGNQPPQGVLLNCPLAQREVVMASRGTKGQSRNLKGNPVNAGARHTNWAITSQAGVS